eukprot:EG_transcript_18676
MATSLLADVVIVDQHLVWGCEEVLGSNLVHQLRRLRYAGFICIRSADDGPNDQALYRQAGANCSVGKDVLGHVMIRQLGAAYDEFMKQQQMVSAVVPNDPPETDSTVAVSSGPTLAVADVASDPQPSQPSDADLPTSSSTAPFVFPSLQRDATVGHPPLPFQANQSSLELLPL